MPPSTHRLANLSSTKLALLARQAYTQVEDVLQAEPIAIVGMGCRFPGGADNPQAYWEMLRDGVDATGEAPADRWDADAWYAEDFAAPGKMNTRRGGFLRSIDGFDAAYFGISGREAERMDPQQRLLLEVAFEAFAEAGLTAAQLDGSRTGVFVASYHNDYTLRQYADPESINLRTLTGTLHSITANRLSYLLNLRGPSMALDTACSSSLVAVHLACQSLRSRDSDLGLAGGVSLMISPEVNVALAKVGFVAPDGRSYTFDSRAAGFSRGEGCGVILLKRLSDALAANDRILAVIRGSAVNQDGRSTVLTAPNGRAQVAVVRAALAAGGVLPEQISHIEAHGTGTLLGDPIEVEALAEVLAAGDAGAESPAIPCALTSVKTNLGHLEAAAGLAGLIKVVLSLQHQAIPPHLHLRELNPHIHLEGTRLFIPTQLTPWPAGPTPRFAGVSSFGIGGTNAHVVLSEAPALPPSAAAGQAAAQDPCLLPLSARSPQALTDLCRAYAAWLRADGSRHSAAAVCAMAALRRNHYEHRLAVVGSAPAELAERLDQLAADAALGRTARSLRAGGSPDGHAPAVIFVFSGQGPQWWAMGRELLAHAPVFRQVVERCDALLQPLAGWSLLAELHAPEDRSRLDQTEVAQPAIFALQMGLDALWRAWGIVPAAVIGHSIGEVAAACSAGSLALEQAVALVYHRARLMQRATGGGQMASVELPAAALAERIAPYGDRLSIAAVNGPTTSVLSGERAAVQAVLADLAQAGVSCRELKVNYAFHSSQMAPLAAELVAALAGLAPQRSTIPLYSTVTGEATDGLDMDAAYWGRNMRQPVRFADAVASAAADRAQNDLLLLVELSPHPVLAGVAGECLAAAGRDGLCLPSLRRGQPERAGLLASLAKLYAAGCAVNWPHLYPTLYEHVALPPYPWQRERYWFAPAPRRAEQAPAAQPELLGPPLRSPALPGVLFQSELGADAPAWLGDHVIGGEALLPATAYLAMALAAGRAQWPAADVAVAGLAIHAALVLPPTGRRTVQLHLRPDDAGTAGAGGAAFQIFSSADGQAWTLHAEGSLCLNPGAQADRPQAASSSASARAAMRAIWPERMAALEWYAHLAARGLAFGPAFRALTGLWVGEGEAVAELQPPAALAATADLVHPAVLDAALQPLMALLPEDAVYLPISVGALRVLRAPGPGLWSHLRLHAPAGPDVITFDATLSDAAGMVADFAGVRVLRTRAEALEGLARSRQPAGVPAWFHTVQWQPQPLPDATAPLPAGQWLILGGEDAVGAALAAQMRAQGRRVHVAAPGAGFARTAADAWTVAADQPDDYRRLLEAVLASDPAPLAGVVHLWSLDLPAADADVLAPQARSLGGLLHLTQALAAAGVHRLHRLLLVTRSSQFVTGPALAPTDAPPAGEQAPIWGMAAALALELPDLHPVCVDLDLLDDAPAQGRQLGDELGAADGERQVAWRAGRRCVLRLVRTPLDATAPAAPCQLTQPRRGLLDDLAVAPAARRAPGPGEVEIRVQAAGLNFRDVLKALDQYPWDFGPLGDECAGEIVAVGDGVSDLQVGQRVLAIAPGAFRSHVPADARLTAPLPDGMSYAEGASIPIAFVTAAYTLRHLAGLRAGERVLIHAAAGGVGLAAVQLAQAAGAEVYATAGSASKRAYLRSLGVAHVFDSRTLAFAEEVRAATGGQGVDVVLNSLAGDFIAASLALLAPGGRFLEIGKSGLLTPQEAAALGADRQYFAVFLGDQFVQEPHLIGALLADLLRQFAAGELQPLPRRTFDFAQAAAAFRYMAQARHIGKIVLLPPADAADDPVRGAQTGLTHAPAHPLTLSPAATYLITGALGGIGQVVAQELVAWGARHLVLVSRRGEQTPGAAELRAALESRGAQVWIAAVDVADRQQLADLLARVQAELPPLRGVIHAAGVLEDGIALQQSWERMQRVLAPKLQGGWNLHLLTEQTPLDFFVCFSSVAGLRGALGQTGYAAANRFLAALAHLRRSQGLPALTIDWGAWGEVGMAARLDGGDYSRWTRQGMGVIDPPGGMAALRLALAQPRPHLVVAPLAGEAAARPAQPAAAGSAPAGQPGALPELVARYRQTPPSLQRKLLLDYIAEQAARTIGLPGAPKIDPGQPLHDLGLDSLMAVELRNLLGAACGATLPATLLFDHPTVEAVAAYLQAHAAFAVGPAPAAEPAQPAAAAPASVRSADARPLEELTDAEAEALLLAELDALK